MKILALEKEVAGATDDRFDPHLKAEAAKVWELQQAGVVREIYFRDDRPTAVLILECENVGDAERVLAELPLVKEGLSAFDLIPLKPYPGLSRLFAE